MSLEHALKFAYEFGAGALTTDASRYSLALTNAGAVAEAAGGADWGSSGSRRLSRADETDLLLDTDYTLEITLTPSVTNTTMGVVTKRPTDGSNAGYELAVIAINGGQLWIVVGNAAGNNVTTLTTTAAIVAGQSNHVVITLSRTANAGNGRVTATINGGATQTFDLSAANTPPIPTVHGVPANKPLLIGENIPGVHTFRGVMRRVRAWKRVLTSAEITQLYASGAGLAFADLVPGVTTAFPAVISRTRNPGTVAAHLRHARDTGRTSQLISSNSNGAYSSFGEPRCGDVHGLNFALRQLLGAHEYATGVVPATAGGAGGPAGGNGEDSWYELAGSIGGATNAWKQTGGRAFDESIRKSTVSVVNWFGKWLRWANGESDDYSNKQSNLVLAQALSPFALPGRACRYHVTYGTYVSNGGTVRIGAYRNGTTTALGTASASAQTGAEAVARVSCDYTNPDATRDVALAIGQHGQQITGNQVIYFRRAEDPARTRGHSVTLACSLGGQSTRAKAICWGNADPAAALIGNDQAQMRALIREAVWLQANPDYPRLMIVLNESLNTRNEAARSVGPSKILIAADAADGASDQCWYDNVEAELLAWRTAWLAEGYDIAGLCFVLACDHPLIPVDALMTRHTEAAFDLAATYGCCAIDMARLFPGESLRNLGAYGSPDGVAEDQLHLRRAGAQVKWTRAMRLALFGDRVQDDSIIQHALGGVL